MSKVFLLAVLITTIAMPQEAMGQSSRKAKAKPRVARARRTTEWGIPVIVGRNGKVRPDPTATYPVHPSAPTFTPDAPEALPPPPSSGRPPAGRP